MIKTFVSSLLFVKALFTFLRSAIPGVWRRVSSHVCAFLPAYLLLHHLSSSGKETAGKAVLAPSCDSPEQRWWGVSGRRCYYTTHHTGRKTDGTMLSLFLGCIHFIFVPTLSIETWFDFWFSEIASPNPIPCSHHFSASVLTSELEKIIPLSRATKLNDKIYVECLMVAGTNGELRKNLSLSFWTILSFLKLLEGKWGPCTVLWLLLDLMSTLWLLTQGHTHHHMAFSVPFSFTLSNNIPLGF